MELFQIKTDKMKGVCPCYCWVRFSADEGVEIGLMREDSDVYRVGEDEFNEIGDMIEMPEKYKRHD